MTQMTLRMLDEFPEIELSEYAEKEWALAGAHGKYIIRCSRLWAFATDRPLAVLGLHSGAWLGPRSLWFMLGRNIAPHHIRASARLFHALDLPTCTAQISVDYPVGERFAGFFGFVPTEHVFMNYRTWVRA